MSDMQDVDCVAAHPVKDPEGIADDCDHTNMGALRDARGSFGRSANAIDDIGQPMPDGLGYPGAGMEV
jgi:hypothetical protein